MIKTDSIDLGEDYFRADIGEHRIIDKFDATTLYVVLIGKRNDAEVYERFARKKK